MSILPKRKILIFGITGMVGSGIFNILSKSSDLDVCGIVRRSSDKLFFPKETWPSIYIEENIIQYSTLAKLFEIIRPDLVINAIGLIKQSINVDSYEDYKKINIDYPKQLSILCKLYSARFIHLSTDCVFSGLKGQYSEVDRPDPIDLYGESKLAGESLAKNDLVLRTSFLGPQLMGHYSLLDWFLSQKNECQAYTNAYFSGFPTNIFGEILRDYVISNQSLSGVYHIASTPISKYELLLLITKRYGKNIGLIANPNPIIDRSLCGDKFNSVTGFVPKLWPDLIDSMYRYHTHLKKCRD